MDPFSPSDFTLVGIIGIPEVVGLVAIVLLLFASSNLHGNPPPLGARLRRATREFGRGVRSLEIEIKPVPDESGLVYEALTHDNRTAEFLRPQRSDLSELLRAMTLFLAQGFGVGRIPFAPGTFGSLVGFLWFAILLSTGRYEFFLAGALLGIGLSVWLAGAAEKTLNQQDPPSVVIDEIIAIPFCFLPWVTVAWLPQHQLPALGSFLSGQACLATVGILALFRLFDIWKPWPVRQSQRLPGGWGVTIDDVLAAGYVALIVVAFLAIR